MNVETRTADGVLIVRPGAGRITALSGADLLRQALEKAIARGHLAIAVDLDGVEYADSTMLGVLISAFKALNQRGGLVCAFNVGSELREFFHQTVLDRVIDVCKDESEALGLFAGRARKKRRGLLGRFS